jgi:hypothetical protein
MYSTSSCILRKRPKSKNLHDGQKRRIEEGEIKMAGATDGGYLSEDDPRYKDGWTISFSPYLRRSSLKREEPENKLAGETEAQEDDLPAAGKKDD